MEMIGRIVSHYQIVEKLGEGGMGLVYKAHDLKLDRDVALKFLPANLAASEEEIGRFEQEAKAISALNHPHIETIYDVDDIRGQKYLVLEYIPGGTLKTRVKQLKSEGRYFPIEKVLDYGIQMAEGLAHAHRHQIIHRDVKTENIMFTEEGKIKLTDFGLAKLKGTIQKTKAGSTLGTAAYMSPEQVRGEEVDQKSDIFSLGVVLYELATSRLPFIGEYEAAVSYSILHENPPSLRSVRPDVPAGLEKIIDRCLEKEKTKRYQDADEMAEDLRIIKGEISSSVKVERKSVKKLPLFIFSGIALLALIILAYFFLLPKPEVVEEKSIAVLPFADFSPQKDQEYFCDGMTEELINRLSHLQGLRVPARTSAFVFKGKTQDIKEIGNRLKVQMALEGSVRKSGDELRITAQLINVADGYHLWSDTYDRKLSDVFAIQDEISSAIVNTLKLKLTSEEAQKLTEHPINNVNAYERYLKAWRQIYRFDEKSLDSAFVYLQTAIDIMGDNAELYAGMATAHGMRANIGIGQEEDLRLAKEYANKALALKPDLAAALVELGLLSTYQEYPRNMRDGFRYAKKAFAANPISIEAIRCLAISYSQIGKPVEAKTFVELFERHDPLNPWRYAVRGLYYAYSCQFEPAMEQFQKFYRADSTSPLAQELYSEALAYNSHRDQALAVISYSGDFAGQNVEAIFCLFMKYALLQDRESAFRLMTPEFQKTCRRDFEWSYYIAARFSQLGAKEEALDWLENAIHHGFINYPALQCDPFLDKLSGEERFVKLLEKAKYEWEHFEVE